MIKYKVKKEENGDVLFEKSGKKFTFLGSDVLVDLVKITAKKKELVAQLELNQAEMTNIERNYPFVKEMEDKNIHAAHMYWEAKQLRDACTETIPKYDEALEETEQAIKDVLEQTGINIRTYGQKRSRK